MDSALIELFRCIKQNDDERFRSIVSKSAINLNQYLYGATPLFYCIECKNEVFALELLRNSIVQPFLKSNLEISCLQKAMENKLFEVIQVLLKRYKKDELSNVLENSNETLLTMSIKFFDQSCGVMLIEGDPVTEMNFINVVINPDFSSYSWL